LLPEGQPGSAQPVLISISIEEGNLIVMLVGSLRNPIDYLIDDDQNDSKGAFDIAFSSRICLETGMLVIDWSATTIRTGIQITGAVFGISTSSGQMALMARTTNSTPQRRMSGSVEIHPELLFSSGDTGCYGLLIIIGVDSAECKCSSVEVIEI
jgi:hypothetical protein